MIPLWILPCGQDDKIINWDLLKGKTQVDESRHMAPAPSWDFTQHPERSAAETKGNPPADDRDEQEIAAGASHPRNDSLILALKEGAVFSGWIYP